VIDSACPSVMLDDKDIDVCCDAGAEKYADDPPQRQIADHDMEHRARGNVRRDPAAGRRHVCAGSARKNVVSPVQIALGAFFANSAFQFVRLNSSRPMQTGCNALLS